MWSYFNLLSGKQERVEEIWLKNQMKKVKNRSTYSLKWKCDLCTMNDYCNLGHFIWQNPSPPEMPTSRDLKSGDCLFCSTTNIKHPCPHNCKSTQWPQIMTWVWLRTLSEVSHKLPVFSLNFSLAGKGPFLTGKAKNMFQTRTLLPGEGFRVHEGFYFWASSQPIDRKVL